MSVGRKNTADKDKDNFEQLLLNVTALWLARPACFLFNLILHFKPHAIYNAVGGTYVRYTFISPTYANIFMGYFGAKHIYPRIKDKCIKYLRYIDDIFMVWTETPK